MSIKQILIYNVYMIDYQRCFIENLKSYRRKRGISQSKLAELCDVSTGTIGNIECGITKPSFDLILLIAEKLGIKPETLFYSVEQPYFSEETERFSKKQLQSIKNAFNTAVRNAVKSLEQTV